MSILKAIEQHADAHVGLPAVEFIREQKQYSKTGDLLGYVEIFKCCGCDEQIEVFTFVPSANKGNNK